MASKTSQNRRMQQIVNNPPKGNTGNGVKSGGEERTPVSPPFVETDIGGDDDTPKRIPASEEDYLAVQLHQTRAEANDLRAALVAEKELSLRLRKEVTRLEIAAVDKDNAELRKRHGLKMGKTIHKDESTGEVWWELVDSN